MPGRRRVKRLCHVNLLKPYYRRVDDAAFGQDLETGVRPALAVTSEGLAPESDGVLEPDESLLCGWLKNSESLGNLDKLLAHLSESRRSELSVLVRRYPCLFGDIPSETEWIEHDIDGGTLGQLNSFTVWHRGNVIVWRLRLHICSNTILLYHHHLVGLLRVFWCRSRMAHLDSAPICVK